MKTSSLPQRLSNPGPILQYLEWLQNQRDPILRQKAKDAIGAARQALSTPEGAILLELIEKATLNTHLPPNADQRALEALNSQRFIPLDLWRILSDENERLVEATNSEGARR